MRRASLVLLVLAGFVVPDSADASRLPRTPRIVSVPVSFRVRDINRSDAPCPPPFSAPDMGSYLIKGHLVAPRRVLRRPSPSLTIYLHGTLIGERIWGLAAPRGYEWAREEARTGHASLTIDRLGFGSSGQPRGFSTCIGAEADIIHQLVTRLRNGTYDAGRIRAPRFDRVALLGFSAGGPIAEVESYSFGDVSALLLMSSAVDEGGSPDGFSALFNSPDAPGETCARGGDPKSAGGPAGYTYVYREYLSRLVYNAQPDVLAAAHRMEERDPCGYFGSLPGTILTDRARAGDIRVPVLLLFGQHDLLFPPSQAAQEAGLFADSHDVTLVEVPDTGHLIPLERTAPASRAKVSAWLAARGF
jgi:pimeloyl-ACP methyl ester carboxylesterase